MILDIKELIIRNEVLWLDISILISFHNLRIIWIFPCATFEILCWCWVWSYPLTLSSCGLYTSLASHMLPPNRLLFNRKDPLWMLIICFVVGIRQRFPMLLLTQRLATVIVHLVIIQRVSHLSSWWRVHSFFLHLPPFFPFESNSSICICAGKIISASPNSTTPMRRETIYLLPRGGVFWTPVNGS